MVEAAVVGSQSFELSWDFALSVDLGWESVILFVSIGNKGIGL